MGAASRVAKLSHAALVELVVAACEESPAIKSRADALVAQVAPLPASCVDAASDESVWLATHLDSLEMSLGEAVSAAINARAKDPISLVASHLQAVVAAATAPSVKELTDRARHSALGAADSEWDATKFFADVSASVADALLQPLGVEAPKGKLALAFVKELGTAPNRRACVRALLANGLDLLTDRVVAATECLAAAGAASAAELSSKFAAETFTLSYASLSAFFSGLEGRVGPPSPQLRAAMAREHCSAVDSKEWFSTPNYGVETKSEIEWWYVVDPEAGLAKLRLDCYPSEKHSIAAGRRRGDASAKPLAALVPKLRRINTRLAELQEPELLLDEVLAARLYTGPMFHKYNTTLRGIGDDGAEFMRASFHTLTRGNAFTTTLHVINSAVVKGSKLTKAVPVYRGFGSGVLPKAFWEPNVFGVRGGVESAFMSTTTNKEVALSYATGGKGGLVFEIRMGMVNRGADLSWLSQYPHEAEVLFAPLTGIELHSTRVEGSAIVAEVSLSVNLTALTIEQVVSKLQRSHLSLNQILSDGLRAAEAPALALRQLETLHAAASKREPEHFNDPDHFKAATIQVLEAQRAALKRLADRSAWHTKARDEARASGGGRRSGGGSSGGPSGGRAIAERMRLCAALCASSGELDVAAELLQLASEEAPAPDEDAATVTRAVQEAVQAAGRERWPDADVAAAQRALVAALPLVREGLLQPWPAVVAQLGANPAAAAAMGRLVAQYVTDQPDPFAVGEEVLAFDEEWQQFWKAQITHADPPTKVAAEDGAPDDLSVPRFTVNAGSRKLPKGKVGKLPAKHVLAAGTDGPGALLLAAAKHGRAELVRELLVAGVNVLSADLHANTALHLAADRGHLTTCLELLKCGWHDDVRNRERQTPRLLAVEHMDIHRLCVPLAVDLDVFVEGDIDRTALDTRRYGQLIHGRKEAYDYPLLAALTRRASADECAGLLAVDPSVAHDKTPTIGLTALMIACHSGDVETARRLLEDHRVEVNLRTRTGLTALSIAAANSRHELVPLLVANRADLEACTKSKQALHAEFGVDLNNPLVLCGGTALMMACWATPKGEPGEHVNYAASNRTVKALLEAEPRGANVHAEDDVQGTALTFAAFNGKCDVVQMLLEAGAPIDRLGAWRESRYTPLMYACMHSHGSSIEVLIKAKADLNVRDEKGETAFLHACGNNRGSVHTVKRMLQAAEDGRLDLNAVIERPQRIHGHSKTTTALVHAAQFGCEPVVRVLLEAGAVIDQPRQGWSNNVHYNALSAAASSGQEGTARALLQFKADPNSMKHDGFSAVMSAAWKGNEPIVRLLCEAKADLEGRIRKVPGITTDDHHDGYTALMFAAATGDPATVATLLQAGPKVEATSTRGATAETVAKEAGHTWVARMISEHSQKLQEG